MELPGTWMTESGSVLYRVVPKCACSTIGQILYRSDHGRFFDGDIHDATEGLHKWAQPDSRRLILDAVTRGTTFTFTAVRNPYSRILSAFFDKICGTQRNGGRYRGTLLQEKMAGYGVDGDRAGGDQIASFRRFLLFARDTILFERPMPPDIHWSSIASHVGTLIANGGRYDRIFRTEAFAAGMQGVLDAIDAPHPVDLDRVPRFNESADHGPTQAYPTEAYFDDLARHIVGEIYGRDFDLFGYDPTDPARRAPAREIDLDRVHAALS